MKITITQIVFEFDGPQDEEPAPVREPNPLDQLAAGPQLPPSPSDGRHYRNVNIFNQWSETT